MMEPLSLALGTSEEDFPRRLLEFPYRGSKDVLAYGGIDGCISYVTPQRSKVARRFDDEVRAVAASSDGMRVAVGFDDGSTMIFGYESLDGDMHPFLVACQNKGDDASHDDDIFSQLDESQTSPGEFSFSGPRFSAPIRHLAFEPRSYLLAVASEAGVCVVDASSSKTVTAKGRFLQEMAEKEHDSSGIRGVAYGKDKGKMLLATLGMDGRLCVWDVTAPSDDPELEYELVHRDVHKCISKMDIGEINGADAYDQSCLPAFIHDHLWLPGSTDCQLRSKNDVSKPIFLPSMDGKGHIDTIVTFCGCGDGKHVVTGGRDGRLVVWELLTDTPGMPGRFVKEAQRWKAAPTGLLWKDSMLYVAFADGTFTTMEKSAVLPATPKGKKQDASAALKRRDQAEDVSDDDDIFSEAELTKNQGRSPFVNDEADEDDDSKVEDAATAVVASVRDNLNSIDDLDDSAQIDDLDTDDRYEPRLTTANLPAPQPAFAPSSTPLDLPRRIMCWNHVGTITLLRKNDGMVRNTVDISFTDSAFRRPVSFTDNMDFIIGSLGEDGALFATDLVDDEEDDDSEVDELEVSDRIKAVLRKSKRKNVRDGENKPTGSSLYFHRFETFGALKDKDWYLTLPTGERVLGCACAEGWAACVTSRRFLRIFSSGGNQCRIIWLPGEPVTMVGRSSFVAVVYHEASPLPDGTQKLGYMVYDALSMNQVSSGSLAAISARSSLTWAGISKEGSLMAMDSDGMLSMLAVSEKKGTSDDFTWEWAPILDTVGHRKSMESSFWPVCVQDGKLVCVPLTGRDEYPNAGRRPVTTSLSLRQPFAKGTMDQSTVLEELSIRAGLALAQKKFMQTAAPTHEEEGLEDEYHALCAQVDKVTLKLFMAVVEAGKLERALDLVDRLHLEKSYDIAVMVADRLNHRNLSDRVEELRERRFILDDDDDDDGTEANFDSIDNENLTPADDDGLVQSRQISPDLNRRAKRKFDAAPAPSCEQEPKQKRRNPFAKNRVTSPTKTHKSSSPLKTAQKKIPLSRMSTFSSESRKESKSARNLL